MGKPRKLWSQLAQSTRDRYTKAGVTARQYNSGNIPPEAKAKAQRKKTAGRPRQPKAPLGQVFTSRARGRTKRFTELSPKRQRADIRRVMGATGASESEARRLLIDASKRGEILRFSPGYGPATKEQAESSVGHAVSVRRARAFSRLPPAKRSELARAWANRRYGNVLYFDGEIPDWPYPELDADAWQAYQSGEAA